MPLVQGLRIDVRQELRPRDMSQTGKREFLHLLKELGLQLSAFSFFVRRAFYDQAELDQRIAATREAMDFASLLKVRHLCLRVGRIPEETEAAEFGLLLETLNDLARHGNRVGVTLAVIPGGESVQAVEQLLSRVTAGPVAIDFDPARMLTSNENPAQLLRSLHRYVEQFTARDAVRDFSGGTEETALGRGEVVWDELLATLGEMDYPGWITVQRTGGNDRVTDVEHALKYLHQVMGEF